MNATGPDLAAILLHACDRRGWWRPREGVPADPFFFGVRHPSDLAGPWDDVLGCLVWRDGWDLRLWRGTTDPGRDGAGGQLHPRGVAVLVPGQYRACWVLGLHRGQPALVQRAPRVFRVWRDREPDGVLVRSGQVYDDVSGLNGHAPWRDDLERVGLASLGCQVWHRRADHDEALELAREQERVHGWTAYSYTLWDAGESPEVRGILGALGRWS